MAFIAMTKSASVYHEIKKKIMEGELEPGTHLVINQIATEFGISDIPVREALKELNAEGLVETIPHVGSRVTGISVKNIKDLLAMRECLEPFAAELAVGNADEEVIKKLEEYCNEMNKAYQENDIKKYGRINNEFHDLINQASDNQLLAQTLAELNKSEKRMRMIFQIFPEIIETSSKEHFDMVRCIKERNKHAMGRLMYEHKKRSFDKMRKFFKI
jgi:DNA-binding GntR family transcriptional regulator